MLRFIQRIFQGRSFTYQVKTASPSIKLSHNKQPMGNGKEFDFGLLSTLSKVGDFHFRKLESVICCYISTIVSVDMIDTYIIQPLSASTEKKTIEDIVWGCETTQIKDVETCMTYILKGWAIVLHNDGLPVAVNVFHAPERSVTPSENETTIFGPQEAFIESLMTNVGILRKRVKTPDFQLDTTIVGSRTKTMMGIIWLEGIAAPEHVAESKRRIDSVCLDGATDISELREFMEDNPYSPFPNFVTTIQPQKAVSALLEGKVLVMMDGSPSVWIVPSTFWELLQSPDDYYNNWLSASLLRVLRMAGLGAALFFTAIYVAVTTFHYQMIPKNMLLTLLETRRKVPFPPLYEAMMMEFTIEFLREAGARLPTKIGQTIGIVGGIVIGQAAVLAGFTSNFLIIAVAFSAIASFVIPSYLLANAVRVIRYGIIIIAAFYGFVGIVFAFMIIALHLLEMRSLGAPYLSPLVPIRVTDWKDSVVRFPFSFFTQRPTISRPQDVRRKRKHSKGEQ